MRRIILKIAPLRYLVFLFYRFFKTKSYLCKPTKNYIRWLFSSKEVTNFTYHLNELNTKYLIAFVAEITNKEYKQIEDYIKEVQQNEELKYHIKNAVLTGDEFYKADTQARYGRRLGWYALIRALKPEVVIETGVDKGLGACIITAALIENNKENAAGYYYGTDINPKAGYFLKNQYADFGEIIYGDSIETLKNFGKKIDLFINDSDHSAEYEANEYQTIKDKLSEKAVIIGDNSHCTDTLFCFAQNTGRKFRFFKEEPANHWYPGSGIGAAW